MGGGMDSVFRLRLPEATRAAWEVAAAERGVAVARLVRDAVDFYLGGEGVVRLGPEPVALAGAVEGGDGSDSGMPDVRRRGTAVPSPVVVAAPASARRRRSQMCEHRIPATSFCKVCDG